MTIEPKNLKDIHARSFFPSQIWSFDKFMNIMGSVISPKIYQAKKEILTPSKMSGQYLR